jgi:hypothetical protein
MRRAAILAAALIAVSTASAADIKTGRDLVQACRTYAAIENPDNARAPHDCRTFLQGFAVSLLAREEARRNAMLNNLPIAARDACVRMPDFISFRELAARIVNFGDTNPGLLNLPAAQLAQKTLERDFPCPPAPPAR